MNVGMGDIAGKRRGRIFILGGVVVAGFVGLFLWPRIPLPAGYHDFADQRTLLRIPNAGDVLSNIPFFVVGILGLVFLLRNASRNTFREQRERLPYLVFFAGVALTGLGSGYYHLAPDNQRLIWDLWPMTFSFVSLVTAALVERVSTRLGLRVLLPLMGLGAASVFYWYAEQLRGHGDLRFYLYVQFFSAIVIGVTVLLFPPAYTGTKYFATAFVMYVLAKLFETFDAQILAATRIVSGHTLKHLTAGAACYAILRMLKVRRSLGLTTAEPRRQETTTKSEPGRGYVAVASDAWHSTSRPDS